MYPPEPAFAAEPARRPHRTRMAMLQAATGLVIALGLVVPESEIRAKGFKLHLIVKNVSRLAA